MKTPHILLTVIAIAAAAIAAAAKEPQYKIRIDRAALAGFNIEVNIPDARGSVQLAMAAHPEYDDRYTRYVEAFEAWSGSRSLSFTRPDPAVWKIDGITSGLTVRYRVAPPAKEREWRQTWKPYLTTTGGMVGDLHMLMYAIGTETQRARLVLDMPDGWAAASGLEPTSDPRMFAGTVEDILDSPVMVGKFDERKFQAGGVPHQVVIFSPPGSKPVDAKPIFDGLQKLADESIKAFGRPPYQRYAFLLENGGSAALEHKTSLNAPASSDLADIFDNIAHEYVHVWNLMDVRPRERIGLKHKFAEPTGVLWWSEGATIMFADMLLRRIGIPVEHPSRTARLESILARYHSSPGYSKLSAEAVSRSDSHPELLGDDFASTHLQGELLVLMLDLMIRDKTDGQSDATHVMRLLAERFDERRGIVNADIEKAISDVCGCNARPFFNQYISSAAIADHNSYLSVVGLRADVRQIASVDDQGLPSVDLRIGPLSTEGEFRVRILNSNSTWARAGIRTGDRIVSADGRPISGWNDFRGWLRQLKIGDKGRVVVVRDAKDMTIEVPITGFDRSAVSVTEMSNVSEKQGRLRDAWLAAK